MTRTTRHSGWSRRLIEHPILAMVYFSNVICWKNSGVWIATLQIELPHSKLNCHTTNWNATLQIETPHYKLKRHSIPSKEWWIRRSILDLKCHEWKKRLEKSVFRPGDGWSWPPHQIASLSGREERDECVRLQNGSAIRNTRYLGPKRREQSCLSSLSLDLNYSSWKSHTLCNELEYETAT